MSEKTVIEAPDRDVMRAEYSGLLVEAEKIKVSDLPTLGLAKKTLQMISNRKKLIRERLDPIADAANKAHKGITSLRADLLAPLEAVERTISVEVDGYEAKERERAEKEAREKEEAVRKAEEERKLAEAVELEGKGLTEAAESVLAEPVEVPSLPAQPKTVKLEGESARTNYSAECYDLLALAKYVVAHPEDLALLAPNGPALNARARSQKKGFKLPGCRLKEDVVRSFRNVDKDR